MKHITLAILILVLFSGCYLKSVHPLVSQEDAVLIPELQGTWLNDDELWTFIHDPNEVENIDFANWDIEPDSTSDEAIEYPVYLILVSNIEEMEKEPIALVGRVTELNGFYFLDLSVFDTSTGNDNLMAAHQFPVHTFSRIEVDEHNLSIEFFKSDWIQSLIEGNRVRIKHEKTEESILITASTNELRKFVEKYSDDEEAFEDPISLSKTYESF